MLRKWAEQNYTWFKIMKSLSNHKNFITKIYFITNFDIFTKFLNHENLGLMVYSVTTLLKGSKEVTEVTVKSDSLAVV